MGLVPIDATKPDGTISRNEMLCLGIRGALAQSNSFGFATCGAARAGDDVPIAGIYSSRPLGYNQFTGRAPESAHATTERSYYVKRTYTPTNPQTATQQAWRAVCAAAVAAWKSLTDLEKSDYNKRASRRGRYGYHYFISEYLKAHRT